MPTVSLNTRTKWPWLKFLNVEKNIAKEQAEIKARHEKAKQE